MEQKVFSIFKNEDVTKLQIGEDIFGLDESERKNILNCLVDIKQSRMMFPSMLRSVAIMYPNGIIATTISVGKMDITGTKYLVITNTLAPTSSSYEVNTFMITDKVLNGYIGALSV